MVFLGLHCVGHRLVPGVLKRELKLTVAEAFPRATQLSGHEATQRVAGAEGIAGNQITILA